MVWRCIWQILRQRKETEDTVERALGLNKRVPPLLRLDMLLMVYDDSRDLEEESIR